ncbi:MAG: ABC transporter transmembrane domain-containing protein, partial [Herbaspirillum sp.]
MPLLTNLVPLPWQTSLQSNLRADESVLAVLELDLNARLRFEAGLVVLTTRRVLASGPLASDPSTGSPELGWVAWELVPELDLNLHDHAGVGSLELNNGAQRLAGWRFTLAQNPAAMSLVRQFVRQRAALLGNDEYGATEQSDVLCPQCNASLEPGLPCAKCAPAVAQPPSAVTLFRLWRFAKPYQGQLLAGFLLTLVATAANLVPPYLTMPLMDNILIPYQNGKPIDVGLAALYLSGLFGSALVAWGLSWAKTYILALASERIGADLRTSTYEHLMRLSQE